MTQDKDKDKDIVKLDEAIIVSLRDADDRANGNEVVCTAVFYKNGRIKLFSSNADQADEVRGDQAVKQKYKEITDNAQQPGKSGLAVYKNNPWVFVYTLNGVTYTKIIHP